MVKDVMEAGIFVKEGTLPLRGIPRRGGHAAIRAKFSLHVTPLGRLFIRIIAMRFDAYIQNNQRKGRYSQTV